MESNSNANRASKFLDYLVDMFIKKEVAFPPNVSHCISWTVGICIFND